MEIVNGMMLIDDNRSENESLRVWVRESAG